jgi:hypothetical protein
MVLRVTSTRMYGLRLRLVLLNFWRIRSVQRIAFSIQFFSYSLYAVRSTLRQGFVATKALAEAKGQVTKPGPDAGLISPLQ